MSDTPDQLNEDPVGDRMNELMIGRMARHGQYVQASSQALRARGQVIQEEISRERHDYNEQQLELNRMKTLVEISKQKAVLQQEMAQQQHIQGALSKLGELNPNDPEYTKKMAQVFNEHPMATKDPVIQDIVRNQIATRQTVEKTANTLYTLTEEEKIRNDSAVERERLLLPGRIDTAGGEEAAKVAARNKGKTLNDPTDEMNTAIASGKVTAYGSFTGKDFTETPDKTKATHVQVEYQDPKTGKYEVNQIPVDSYNKAVGANTPAEEMVHPTTSTDKYF